MASTPFGQFLAEARGRASLSQTGIDTQMEWSKGYTAQLESGRLRPPDKANCDQLDTVLRLPHGTTWTAAKVERLQRLDADLAAEWRHREEQASAGGRLSLDEKRVARALRKLDKVTPSGSPDGGLLARDLASALEAVIKLSHAPVACEQVIAACRTLRNFADMLPGAQLALLQSAAWTAHIALEGDNLTTLEATPLRSARTPAGDVSTFVSERCTVDASARARDTDLYLAYRVWREQAGRMPCPTGSVFAHALRDEGFTPRKIRGVRIWLGLRLS